MSDDLKPDPAVLAQMQGAPKGFYLLGFQDAVKAAAAQPQQATEMHAAKCPALTGGTCECLEPSIAKAWDRYEAKRESLALQNCRQFAARHRREEWATTILRFCAEGGVTGSPLREAAQPQQAAAPKGE